MKVRQIEIQAREWFDKTYGNSYFSAQVYINDELVLQMPFQYGYENHYKSAALKELQDLGIIQSGHFRDLHAQGITVIDSKVESKKSQMWIQWVSPNISKYKETK